MRKIRINLVYTPIEWVMMVVIPPVIAAYMVIKSPFPTSQYRVINVEELKVLMEQQFNKLAKHEKI